MKDKTFFLNILLTVVLTAALLSGLLLRTFVPWLVLPALDVPVLAALSLAALVLDAYLAPGVKRCWAALFLLSAVTFGVLPLAGGLVSLADAALLGLVGGVIFTALTFLFTSASARLSSGKTGALTPLMTGVCLFLAVQCFAGMLL